MRNPPYTVENLSLVAALNRTKVADVDQSVRGFYVRKLSVLTEVQLHFGSDGAPITFRQGEGIDMSQPGALPLTGGIYLTAPAGGAGASAELLTVFDDGSGDAWRVAP